MSNPLSLYLMSVIYTYPGGILSQMMLGEPPLVFLSNTNQLLSFSLVWYIMFYTRISLLFNIRNKDGNGKINFGKLSMSNDLISQKVSPSKHLGDPK